KPFFCAVNGACIGGGAGIALSCDIRVMSEEARFGWPQARIGLSSTSGPLVLARLVPANVAYEYLFTGEYIDAPTALRLNLVNRVVPPGELRGRTEELARKVLANAPL